MIQLSLDDEPPSIFRGKKEVKKKSKNLHQLFFCFKNESCKINLKELNNKKLEAKIKDPSSNSLSSKNYSALEKSSSEEKISFSGENIKFSKINNSKGNLYSNEINYLKINEKNSQEKTENSNFYFNNTEYNFIFLQTFIKDNNKEKNYYSESREKQEKEQDYESFSFEDEKTTEENTLIWNAKTYN